MSAEKSYVTKEQNQCLVCGKMFETGSILLDRRLRKSFEPFTVTGHGLCSEHKREGFVTLIGCTNTDVAGDRLQPWDAKRSGRFCMIKREAWASIFNVPPPPDGIGFVEDAAIDLLASKTEGGGQP